MFAMDLMLDRWQSVSPSERQAVAARLARQLPSGFSLHSIQTYQLGARQQSVALYRHGEATFALVPCGPVTLGYDAGRPWEPMADEQESWRETAEEYGIDKTLHEYVAEVTLRPREVVVGPLLIETAAAEVGWEPVEVIDPEVQEILRDHGPRPSVEVHRGGGVTRVRTAPDGAVLAERFGGLTHAGLSARLAARGLRLPTSDEWEYACGCGTDTLFRWGDHVPCDRYPIDAAPAPSGAEWDLHRRPNAFGLLIASDPYQCELVAEPGTTRGGDGGASICGGAGFFVGWLPLATAYFEEHACRYDADEPVAPGFTFARRVLDLR